jgi:RNA polymerase sigma factor (TIGR02999 family)
MERGEDITRLLEAACGGDREAHGALYRRLQGELRELAGQHMRDERRGHTLQPTAVIHEAWLRLFGDAGDGPRYEGRAHFLRAASAAMRHVLIDHARRKLAGKRGGGAAPARLTDLDLEQRAPELTELLAVHEALERLEAVDPDQAEVVQLRYFGGLEIADVAAVAGVSERTIKRRWAYARAWLYREIGGG